MADQPALEALLRSQAEELSSLRQQLTDLQASESSLRARLLDYSTKAKASDDQALAPFLAEVARVKAEQKAFADSQAAIATTLQEEFSDFRKSLRLELAGLRTAVSARLRAVAAAAPAPPPAVAATAAALAQAAADDARVADGHSVVRADPANNPLEGLVAALGRASAIEKGVLEVTASSVLAEDRLGPQNAADAIGDTSFVSKNEPGQWIRYDFKDRKVALTHYALRSRFDGFKGSNNPRDWVLEVSNDGSTWVIVDEQTGNSDLNGKNVTQLFAVREAPDARYVQLRQTGTSHSGKHFLALSGFELFGALSD